MWNNTILELSSVSWAIGQNVWKNGKKDRLFDKCCKKNLFTHCEKFSSLYLVNWLIIFPSRSVTVGSGRVGPFHHGYRLIGKKNIICSMSDIKKKLKKIEILRCFDFPYDCGKKNCRMRACFTLPLVARNVSWNPVHVINSLSNYSINTIDFFNHQVPRSIHVFICLG